MKKVIILANSSGGLYDFRNGLLLRLLEKGYEVVCSLPDDVCTKEISTEGCRVIHTDINRRGVNPGQDLKLIKDYKGLLESEKPDIVITYTIKPNIYGGWLCGKLHIPYISTITGLGSTFENDGILKKVIVGMYKLGLKKCECVFFQNAENRAIFRRLGIKGKTDELVGGSGVDISRHVAEEYPVHDGYTRFIYIGRLMKEKGTDEYLEAARQIHEKYGAKVQCAVIGYCDGDYEEKLRAAEEHGYMENVPFQKNIAPWIADCDTVVMPSYHEGMSNVIMEAAATARPVLASDISGCRELIDNGRTGFLFEAKSSAALFEAMDRFMSISREERCRMGMDARKKMVNEFDRQCIIDAYIDRIGKISG